MKRNLLSILFIVGSAMMSSLSAKTNKTLYTRHIYTYKTAFKFNTNTISNGAFTTFATSPTGNLNSLIKKNTAKYSLYYINR